MIFEFDGRQIEVQIRTRRPDLVLDVDGHPAELSERPAEAGAFAVEVNGRRISGWRYVRGDDVYLRIEGRSFHLRRIVQAGNEAAATQAANEVLSDMPGTVIALHVAPGTEVTEGDRLLTIESMKLQVTIAAPRNGRIATVHVAEDASFDRGVPLVSFAIPQADAAGE